MNSTKKLVFMSQVGSEGFSLGIEEIVITSPVDLEGNGKWKIKGSRK